MTSYEVLSTLVALLALVVSTVSLVRTRKNAEIQTELTKIGAQLAEKQLSRLIAEEDLEGQPRFAIRAVAISGTGDPQTSEYRVTIKLRIDNSGPSILESKSVGLVTLQGGVYIRCPEAWIELADRRNGFNIEGEHKLVIKRGADLLSCALHLQYVDGAGKDKIQEFRVFLEGPWDHLPSAAFFTLVRVITIVPSTPWRLP